MDQQSEGSGLASSDQTLDQSKKRRKTSDVWSYYREGTCDGTKLSQCLYCGMEYSKRSGMSTLANLTDKHGLNQECKQKTIRFTGSVKADKSNTP